MAKNAERITLGSGDLYLNNVDVGYLGDVELSYEKEELEYVPGTELSPVKVFMVGESASLTAKVAELNVANMRLAMGVNQSVSTSTSFPAYDPSSFSVPASFSADVLTFGGNKNRLEVPLRFEHTRPDGKKVIVIFYNATATGGFKLPFGQKTIMEHDITYKALAVSTRSAGDKLGVIVEQINEA